MRYLLIPLLFFSPMLPAQPLAVYDLRTEHRADPIGIDAARPRLSWKIRAGGRGVQQIACAIRVARSADFSKKSLLWESGRRESSESVLQKYGGPALQAGTRYYWQIKVWDNRGLESPWSAPAFWETGLLNPASWKARWIEPETASVRYSPAPLLRREFVLKKKVARARAYVSSHGFYELRLNGQQVSDAVLNPGWTAYHKRLQYQTYDVTPLLRPGPNALGALLGDGWYRGTLGWEKQWKFYGDKLGLLCQLHLQYADGSEEWLLSDASWKAWLDGPIRLNDIYNGETYDARRELPGWDLPGFDDRAWLSVHTADYPMDNLLATAGPPVRRIQEIKPVRIFRTPKGELVADLGQNMVGWVRLRVQGPAGANVTLRHAEVLDKNGNVYTDNLRKAKCLVAYTLRGGGPEVYEPRFTFMGFRYVQVEGYPGELTADDLTGIVVHSDMAVTGGFECSNSLLNQLQHNIQWGQKGNFVDVPTDCPQRDERLGWTGDAQVFSSTAAFNMDVAAFFTKWLADLAADQRPNGAVPWVIPDVLNPPLGNPKAGVSAGWSDAAVIIPWNLYQANGDTGLLAAQYPSMKAWVEYQRAQSGDSCIWRGGSRFGDWLFYRPHSRSADEPDGHTDGDLIATAFYAHSTHLLAQTARVLGYTSDAVFYKNLQEKIVRAFQREYVTPSGRVLSSSQTAYVLALQFDLLPPDLRPAAARYLTDDIRARRNQLSTGFLGTPYLCHTLSENGYTDLAYTLLLRETYPSWLYPVKLGATTIWERWDGIKTDSSFQDAGMNSFNHYAYGAIGDWMYRVVAGLAPAAPGYRKLYLAPQPTEKLAYARAWHESPYGRAACGWERLGADTLRVDVEVPANATANVLLPGAVVEWVRESGKPLGEVPFRDVRQTPAGVLLEVGSGRYLFEYGTGKR